MAASLVVISMLLLLLAAIPAGIAAGKGRSYAGFFIFGVALFVPALIVAIALSRPSVRSGDVVRTRGRVRLENGVDLPRGWVSVARDVDVIDGNGYVLLDLPDGETCWVLTSSVTPG